MSAHAATLPPATPWRQGLRYGMLGFPLAFVALPLYVVLPNHYAAVHGVPLAWLGAVLLAARALDAVADPWIGRWADALLGCASAPQRAWQVSAVAAIGVAVGFHGLFSPPSGHGPGWLLAWCGGWLLLTYFAYSVLSVIHQAWGAQLGGDATQRARIVAWREGLALAGVLVASALPSLAGLQWTALALAAALVAGLAGLARAPRAEPGPVGSAEPAPWLLPFRSPGFRRLLGVYLINGIAGAVPATLVLFFIRDRLQSQAFEPVFLIVYFAAAGLSIPVWVRLVARIGLARAWAIGMAIAIASFTGTAWLGPGDVLAYAAICVGSGIALGADLALPSALLVGVIQQAGHAGRAEGAYVGWWNFATKLNLAVAAGLALPLLQAFGYAPGRQDPAALDALGFAYGLLPCALKFMALACLLRCLRRSGEGALQ